MAGHSIEAKALECSEAKKWRGSGQTQAAQKLEARVKYAFDS